MKKSLIALLLAVLTSTLAWAQDRKDEVERVEEAGTVLKEIMAAPTVVVTRGRTLDNARNLAPNFLTQILARYEGTRLGRQELDAEILDDVPGALWTRGLFDDHRRAETAIPHMQRVAIGVDPSGSDGDSDDADDIGIIVAGKGIDGRAYVMADRTCNLSPDGWARQTEHAYTEFGADIIAAEKNYGGAMVEAVLRTRVKTAKIKMVTATRGKVVRAEPVAALYEQGRVSHIGSLAKLEDECCQMTPDGFIGEGSPNRVDALVWALTELMVSGSTYTLDNI